MLLPDSAHIQEMETEWQLRHHHRRGKSERGIPAPLNTAAEALSALKLLRPVAYRETLAPAEAVKVCFHDAGHILGSAWLEITDGDEGRPRTLVFSGDLGMSGRPVLCDPDPVVPEADQLLIESTYGDRQHRSLPETEDEIVAAPARTRAARVSRGSRSMSTSRWPMRRRGNHFGQRHVRGRTDQVSPARKPATRRMQHPDRRLPGGGHARAPPGRRSAAGAHLRRTSSGQGAYLHHRRVVGTCRPGALFTWLRGFHKPPRQTFVVHGEAAASANFAAAIRDQLGWLDV